MLARRDYLLWLTSLLQAEEPVFFTALLVGTLQRHILL